MPPRFNTTTAALRKNYQKQQHHRDDDNNSNSNNNAPRTTTPGGLLGVPRDEDAFSPSSSKSNSSISISSTGLFWDRILRRRSRSLQSSYSSYSNFWNMTQNATDFDEQNLVKAQDVSVDAVVTSFYFNAVAFLALMICYECLRRAMPSVYSSRKRLKYAREGRNSNVVPPKTPGDTIPSHPDSLPNDNSNDNEEEDNDPPSSGSIPPKKMTSGGGGTATTTTNATTLLPDDRPLDWIAPVLGVPWNQVRRTAGLDGYFFLRFIRMNVRIAAVSTFWFCAILLPIYATGGEGASQYQQYQHQQGQDKEDLSSLYPPVRGWYHWSAANIPAHGWRMWVAVLFLYLFSGFILFVVQQEYRHFLELRQDFLARGTIHVHPQHHYSIMVENIPYALRSDRALAEYFQQLFPGAVHSASVVLKLPDLEEASARCMRSCRRLEKSIAYWHAKHHRPTHTVGRGRCSALGVDWAPVECHQCGGGGRGVDSWLDDEDDDDEETNGAAAVVASEYTEFSPSGDAPATTTSTSITTHRGLPRRGPKLYQHKNHPQQQPRPAKGTRVDSIQYYTQELAAHSRALFRLQKHKGAIAESGNHSIRAEHWLDHVLREADLVAAQILDESAVDNALLSPSASSPMGRPTPEHFAERMSSSSNYGSITHQHYHDHSSTWPKPKKIHMLDEDSVFVSDDSDEDEISESAEFRAPFSRGQYSGLVRRIAGRLGLDFVVAIVRFLSKLLGSALQNVVGETMSSTGFVTFLDLSSTTCAASAPLTVKASVLDVSVAPESREVIWANAHVSKKVQLRREFITNFLLSLGAILWSFPLAAIQAVSKAENIAQIPGMEWILTIHGGKYTSFINGYLPVVALLCLILVLPAVFEFVALKYERRKTYSDVQASMLGRYFYYQLANIYVSVTAGSIIKSLADIIDKPSHILVLLGKSLPSMVGYFIALLVTKILAGLPMVFLRFGALSRMLFLRLLTDENKLTQRELDAVYRLENVQYGWEFPTQLLVAVIVFTYAVICPVILPFGLLYFMGALMVYKKQILYVYSPVYESGGAMFPLAVQRSLFGLVCAQMTFLGYTLTRGCFYQPIALFPLLFLTVAASRNLQRTYADPSQRLSLERARECDRLSHLEQERRSSLISSPDAAAALSRPSQKMDSLRMVSPSLDQGVEVRRSKFDKNLYRQPVLAQLATEPWTYRRGLPDDAETMAVQEQLRHMNRMITALSNNSMRLQSHAGMTNSQSMD